MDSSSNKMFSALKRITSSIASTANNSFGRVLNFTSSFNERTSLLLAAAAGPGPEHEQEQEPTTAHPAQQPQEAPAPATASVTFDIEAAAPETQGGGQGDGTPHAPDAEVKRVAKMVQTVCLFAASASLVLFVNLPTSKQPGAVAVAGEANRHDATGGAVLYIVDMASICLGLFTSLGLSMFSIVAKSGTDNPAVVRVQKRAMVMAVAFVLVSFVLRMCMMLPPASLESAWLIFVLLAGTVVAYLALAWKLGGGQGTEVALASGSDGTSSTADRV